MAWPIGVFDSGVGGLTVLRDIRARLPSESTVYLGDSARMPYGSLPVERICAYTLECLDHLYYNERVKALVIACNTATSAALDAARQRYAVPVIGVIHSTAREAARTARRRVGVIGTSATVDGGEFVRAIRAENPTLELFQMACPSLALRIESGDLDTPGIEAALGAYLRPLRLAGVDALVLGCTHYPFVRPAIERLMGPGVAIVECGPPTAAYLADLVSVGALEASVGEQPMHRLLTTGDAEALRRVAAAMWPFDLPLIEEVCVKASVEHVHR